MILQAIAAGVRYGPMWALKETRLRLLPGEIVGVFGVSGAGKSSLLQCLSGTIAPSDGWVEADGRDVRECRVTAFQAQNGNGFASLSVADHRAYLVALFDDFLPRRFDLLIDYFSLPIQARYQALSPGMRSQLSTAVCLSLDRPFWMLDEPLLGNDPQARRDLLQLLAGLVDDAHTLVIATHLVDEIEPLLTRAIILERGVVAVDLDVETMRTSGHRLADLMVRDRAETTRCLNQIIDADV